MIKTLIKKTSKLLTLVLPFGLLPLKLFALDYIALEPDVFDGFTGTAGTNDLGQFLSEAFQFGLAIAAALAVIMIVWGGVEIMLSETPFGKTDGKKKIWEAIWGLALALVCWLILYTINPAILDWSSVTTP